MAKAKNKAEVLGIPDRLRVLNVQLRNLHHDWEGVKLAIAAPEQTYEFPQLIHEKNKELAWADFVRRLMVAFFDSMEEISGTFKEVEEVFVAACTNLRRLNSDPIATVGQYSDSSLHGALFVYCMESFHDLLRIAFPETDELNVFEVPLSEASTTQKLLKRFMAMQEHCSLPSPDIKDLQSRMMIELVESLQICDSIDDSGHSQGHTKILPRNILCQAALISWQNELRKPVSEQRELIDICHEIYNKSDNPKRIEPESIRKAVERYLKK